MKRIRRGYTLIESLVVIALTTVTLTITTVTMHALHRADRRVRDDLQGQRSLGQLAAQLRSDAHEALSSDTLGGTYTSPPRALTLALAGGRSVQYSVTANSIERVMRLNGAIEHREIFRLAFPDSHWSVDAARDHTLLSLHLNHRENGEVSARVSSNELVIQAAVGIAAAPGKK